MEQPGLGRSVRYPSRRLEVATALRYLADADYQRRIWCERQPVDDLTNYYSWDMVVHTLYDDTPVAEDPRATVGEILLDEDEAERIEALITALERAFVEVGGVEADECELLATPGWKAVLDAAGSALERLRLG
jgi:hypothetical protein